MKLSVIAVFASLLAGTVSWVMSSESTAAELAPACWQVFWISSGESPEDVPDEIICIDGDLSGYVRESSIFGEMVKICNTVTVSRDGENLTLLVDYSTCPSETPSHTIACPSASGDRLKCSWTYTYAGAVRTDEVHLVREVE